MEGLGAEYGAPAMARRVRLLGLDWGQRRVGIAIADELGLYAHPRGTLPPEPIPEFGQKLAALCREEQITGIVIGLPLDMSGGEGKSAKSVRQFAQRVADVTGLDVELVDERWSSKQAERSLEASGMNSKQIRKHVDEVAAAAVLQIVLDRRTNR